MDYEDNLDYYNPWMALEDDYSNVAVALFRSPFSVPPCMTLMPTHT